MAAQYIVESYDELTNTRFIFTQNTPSSSWIIDHNLGRLPAVTLMDTINRVVFSTIQHTDLNQTVVSFAKPFVGSAICS